MVKKHTASIVLISALLLLLFSVGGCSREKEPLVIYAGNGLKLPLEELKSNYEREHGIQIQIIYAGSQTLFNTIRKSGAGDIYLPGSSEFISKGGEMFGTPVLLAMHVPVIAVHKDNLKHIVSCDDLTNPGVRIGLGNKKMNAIGKISDAMIQKWPGKDQLQKNITIMASTVSELLHLTEQQEVDAIIIWQDMLTWPEANNLRLIPVCPDILITREISAALITGSQNRETPMFMEFLKEEGAKIFAKYGFPSKQ